jgi:ubiquinone/menaquinone biosynthesis C-methylase UbiE
VSFDRDVAVHYEAWYETPEGRRADQLEKAVLGRLLHSFSGLGTVLEVGCGTGHFSRWLDLQGLTAVGLDLSPAMLAEARALDGILLMRGDAHRLPFVDGAFDVVALVTTLEFLERPRQALEEALRVGRRGLLLGVLNRSSLLGLHRRIVGLFRPTVYDDAHFHNVGELQLLLRSVAGEEGCIVWYTTLFRRWWPWPQTRLLWGGFIGMAMIVGDGSGETRS